MLARLTSTFSYKKLVFGRQRPGKDREKNWVKVQRDFQEIMSFTSGSEMCNPLDALKGSLLKEIMVCCLKGYMAIVLKPL